MRRSGIVELCREKVLQVVAEWAQVLHKSLCKGRTLYSVVRDAKIVLDVNKTRQIAQEIVKGMGYLHAKGILHKDLKSKNVFYDNGKVVITDFGLFSISGVLQAGRRENRLRIQNGWLCHLAPEIIRQLSPDTEEDKLPFSKHSDVFALGTIWYELHAREWPFKTQPAEAIIWQVGRGMKPNLSQIGMGKEISDILLFCWAYEQEERPTFTKLMDMLEKLPKRNRRLSHPGHFWKSADSAGPSSLSDELSDESKLHSQALMEHNCLTGTIPDNSIVVSVRFNLEP
ncbi:hypothetical protein DUI87_17585 [Hirundo rustica rustica]|uniref:Protein kinase domain-containing protein n=1 Tax=Hirundo rustica rustica TaxID=333673 RepID=A0A3M0K4Q5_HIRRU|nr:hypothetical protein DUI87_17585 [Hirundo rustica rustica]